MPQNKTSVTDDDDVILSRFQTNPFLLSSVLLTGPLASQLSRAFHHRLQSIREVLECHVVSLAVLGGDLQAFREAAVSLRSSLLEKPPLERHTTTVETDLDGNDEEKEHGDAMQTFCVALGVSVGHASTFRGGPAIAARLSKQHEARRVLQNVFSVPLDICGDGVQWLLVEAAPPTATTTQKTWTTAAATAVDSSTSSSAAMTTATSSTTLHELLYGSATYAAHGSSSSENGASLLISNLRLAAKQLEELLAAYVRWTPLSAPPPILLRSPSLLPPATQKSGRDSGSVGASGYHLLFLGSDHHSNKPSSFASEVLVVPTNMDYIAAGSLFQSQIPHRFELRMPHCLRRLIRSLSTVVPSDDADDGGEQPTPPTTTTTTESTSSCPHRKSYLVAPSVRDDVQSACHIQTNESPRQFRGTIHLWGGSGGGAIVASVTGTVPQLSPQLFVQVASGPTADESCLLWTHPADDVWALGALYLDVLVQCVVSVPSGNRCSEGDDKSSDFPQPSEAAAVVCLSDFRAVRQLIQSLTHELQQKQRPTTEPQQEETALAMEWHTVLAKQMTATAAGWKFPVDLLQRIVDWLHPDPKERWRLFAEAQGLSPSFGPSHDDIDLPALRLVSSSQSSVRVGPRQDGEFIATVNSPPVFGIKQRYARWKLRVEKQISSETAGVNALETRSATMFHRLLQLLWEAREALRHRVDEVHPASARSGGHSLLMPPQQQLDDFLHRLLASPQLSSIAEGEQLNIRESVKMMFHHPTARLPAVLLERLLLSECGAATGDGWIFGDAFASSNNGVGLIPSALDVFTGGSGRKSSSAVSTNPTTSSSSRWTPIDSSAPSSDSISWSLTEQQRANRRLQQKLGPLRSIWPLWALELTPMAQLVYVDTLRSLLLECGADDAASFVGRGRAIAQLRSLVERFGMPPTLRFDIWMALLSSASSCSSSDTSSPSAAASTVHQCDDYNDRNATEKPTTNDRQIAVDIPRCHQYVERLASLDGHVRIRQAVKEWLVLHPSYVYWQGIDSVCAVLLSTRFEQPERLTTLLDRLMETLVPHFFANPSVQGTIQHRLVGMYLLLRYYDPELALHLEAVDCKCELFTISWFLTLFAHVLPLEKIYLVWDFLIVQSSGTATRDATGTSTLPSRTSAGPAVCIATAVVLLSPARSKLLQSDFSQCIGILSGPSLWETVQVDNVLRLAGTFLSAAPPSVIFPNLDCAVGSLIKTSCCALVDAAEIAAACLSNHAGGEEEDAALPCKSIEVLEKLLMKSFAASAAKPPHGAVSSNILGSPKLLLQGGDTEHWTDGGVLLVDTRTLEEQRRRPPSSKSIPLRRRRREEKAMGDSTTTSDDDDDEVEGGIAVSGGPPRQTMSSRRSIVLGSVHHPYDGETGWNVDAVMKDLCERDLYLIPPRSSSFVLGNESDAKGASQVHPNDDEDASAMTKKQESYFDMFAAGVRSAPTVVLLAGMEPENGQQAAESLMRMGVAKVGMVLGGVNRLRAVAPELFLEIEEKLS